METRRFRGSAGWQLNSVWRGSPSATHCTGWKSWGSSCGTSVAVRLLSLGVVRAANREFFANTLTSSSIAAARINEKFFLSPGRQLNHWLQRLWR